MGKNQNDQRNQNSGNLSNQKTNEDFNKRQPNPTDIGLKQRKPNTEVPDISDEDKETEDKTTDQTNDARGNKDRQGDANEKETNDEAGKEKRKGNSDSKRNEDRTRNQNSNKGKM